MRFFHKAFDTHTLSSSPRSILDTHGRDVKAQPLEHFVEVVLVQVLDAAQVHWAVPQALWRYDAPLVVPLDEGELVLVHVERAELRVFSMDSGEASQKKRAEKFCNFKFYRRRCPEGIKCTRPGTKRVRFALQIRQNEYWQNATLNNSVIVQKRAVAAGQFLFSKSVTMHGVLTGHFTVSIGHLAHGTTTTCIARRRKTES